MSEERLTDARVRRTAWILAAVAIVFYLGFILSGVLRA